MKAHLMLHSQRYRSKMSYYWTLTADVSLEAKARTSLRITATKSVSNMVNCIKEAIEYALEHNIAIKNMPGDMTSSRHSWERTNIPVLAPSGPANQNRTIFQESCIANGQTEKRFYVYSVNAKPIYLRGSEKQTC